MNVFSQDFQYKKDIRPQKVKEDRHNMYQSEQINQLDLIRALELAGVHIYKIPLKHFDKKHTLIVNLDEYIQGEKVKTTAIFQGDNTYIYPTDTIPFFDYIDQLLFFTKEEGNDLFVTFYSYAMGSRQKLSKKEDGHFYNWRTYSKTTWVINKEIPLLVYASSWHDAKYDIERFCGVADLSLSEKASKELFDNSPHYFVISYKVSE
jgi:hypothetical protein